MQRYSDDRLAALIQDDRVHRDVYTDPAIFELEMERLWGKAWIYVGHESQVPEPGDYLTATVGRQPVIVTRHRDDEVYVLYNRCAHKGAEVIGECSGHAKQLRCCYHGWTTGPTWYICGGASLGSLAL